MINISKNKLLLFVAFLATDMVVSYRLGYDRRATDLPTQSQSDKTTVGNQTAAIIDKLPDKLTTNSSLLTKSQQTTNAEQAPEIQTGRTPATQNVNSSATEIGPVSVIRVIDGDTIVAEVNGQPIHIRLLGINSPEPNDKRARVACLAQRAKEEAQKLLNGQNVYLEKDPTQGDYDKYNRLLAYVFLANGTSFNKLMIEEGYAYEYTYRLPYKYQSEFKTAQNEARINQKGLWNPDICRN